MTIDKATHDYLSKIGHKGGTIAGAKKDRSHFVMMGKKSAEARNKKKLEAMKTKIDLTNKAD